MSWAQDKAVASNSASGTAVTVTISPTEGAFVVLFIAYRSDTSQLITSVTDNATGGSSSYAFAFHDVNWTTHYTLATVYCLKVKSGVTTITVNVPGANQVTIIAKSWFCAGEPILGKVSAQKTTTSTTPNSNTVTPLNPNNLLLGYVWSGGAAANNTADSPWTLLTNVDDNPDGDELAASEQLNKLPGAYTANFTSASFSWACYILTFYEKTNVPISRSRPFPFKPQLAR